MDRQDFMSFFRDTEKLNTLSTDDRIEVFSSILSGGSDITPELLQGLLRDYGVDDVVVYDKKLLFDRFPILSSEYPTTTIAQTEEELPQQLEVGKWYTYKEGTCDWLMNYQGDGTSCYGFNTNGSWRNDYIMDSVLNWNPATHEEIQTALIKEARRRGYKEGQVIKSFVYGSSHLTDRGEGFKFDMHKNMLWYNYNILFQDGEWAEVINN